MKKYTIQIISLILLFVLIEYSLISKEPSALKRYKLKSGIIEYQLTGNKSGKEILYFDNYGTSEAKFVDVTNKIMGTTTKEIRLDLMQGEWTYSINLETKTGIKVNNKTKELARKYKTDDLEKVAEKMIEAMGGKKVGTESILGKSCTVWETKQLGTKVWVWNGIALKTYSKIAGIEYTSLAVKLHENVSIPPDKLKLPQGVKINEMPMMIGK